MEGLYETVKGIGNIGTSPEKTHWTGSRDPVYESWSILWAIDSGFI